jgi:hypothetical protein
LTPAVDRTIRSGSDEGFKGLPLKYMASRLFNNRAAIMQLWDPSTEARGQAPIRRICIKQ